MSLLLGLLVVGALFGAVGFLIAQNKGVSTVAGFWLGAFLGPFGLIIVALLNPTERAAMKAVRRSDDFSGTPDLSRDDYKLWLTERYEIQKNEVLDSYVVGQKLFSSIEAALEYAHRQEEEESAFRQDARDASARHRADLIAKEEQRRERSRQTWKKIQPYAVGGTLALLVVAGYVEMTRYEQRKQLIAQLEQYETCVQTARSTEDELSCGDYLAVPRSTKPVFKWPD